MENDVKPYIETVIESVDTVDYKNQKEDLTQNFFIYLENNHSCLKSDFRRLFWITFVLDKNTHDIKPYAYSRDPVNECSAFPKTAKIYIDDWNTHQVYGYDKKLKLDGMFDLIVKYLNDRNEDNSVKCVYVHSVFWSHLKTPEFCPRAGVFIQFFEYK